MPEAEACSPLLARYPFSTVRILRDIALRAAPLIEAAFPLNSNLYAGRATPALSTRITL